MIVNIEDIAFIKNTLLVLKKYVPCEEKERIKRIEENEKITELSKTYNKYRKEHKTTVKKVDKNL